MGGLAFASGPDPVSTPRMPPEVYRVVRDRCQAKLRELFVVVATPIEGPAKTSFGDIDVFVAWARGDLFPSLAPGHFDLLRESPKEAVCRILGAIKWKSENDNAVTMVIPWPAGLLYGGEEPKLEPCNEELEGPKGLAGDARPRCIQVDVHVCETLDYLQWMLFKHAHGDLWNLLGTTIRPLGLTIDEVGLYVRIPEIEEHDKKAAKVLLSRDPVEILHFLGLKSDNKQWEEPFTSDEDVFEYTATCRLFWVKPSRAETKEHGQNDDLAVSKRKLKSNDRRRMAYRPLFRKWVEEFLPACRASNRYTSTAPTRDELREQIFAYFPGVRSIYESQAAAWRIKQQAKRMLDDVIKPAVPEDLDKPRRDCCLAALKKIILQGDTSFDGIVAPPHLKDSKGLFDDASVRAWVEENWRTVQDVALEINHQRYLAHKELKGATKRTVSGSEKHAESGAPAEAKTNLG
ncbi:hypothetical protein F4802DRAFT_566719 [Xylaria palmicola]|nr:hypothetical protein F4802DRAFT_566719 [Xylaria palmicola]